MQLFYNYVDCANFHLRSPSPDLYLSLSFLPLFPFLDSCLEGVKHIYLPQPQPENEQYAECHQWKDGACCTPQFTQKLAMANVTNIDGFHWNRCGSLSTSCQRFFVKIECFYRSVAVILDSFELMWLLYRA